jgi:FAD/FMN-containing dehydrogenase
MNRILGFEEVEGQPRVTVEPGLVHDDLLRYLRERGLYLPSDPSSGAISLLGGQQRHQGQRSVRPQARVYRSLPV